MQWNKLFVFGLIAVSGLIGAGYLALSSGAQVTIKNQLLDRKLAIARGGAASIESFFQSVGNSTALLAQLSSMERGGFQTAEELDKFVDQWRDSGLVAGVVLTDSQGVATFNSNVARTPDVGESLADRDYFVWAKNQNKEGKYFFGEPVVSKLGVSEGQAIVPVASPVFSKDAFLGVVVVAVKMAPLIQRLELVKFSDQTKMYLIDERGSLLYSSYDSQVLSYDIINGLEENTEGEFQKDGQLIAYSPVSFGNRNWLLIVSLPAQQISSSAIPLNIRQAVVLILVSLTTLAFGIYVSRKGWPR